MDIQDTRRANLAIWLQTHSVPAKEKSLFSQLKGTGSFGERVARRLETAYDMGVGFLDQPADVHSPKRGQKTPLSSEAKLLIENVERIDGLGGPARKILSHMRSILALAESMGDPHNANAVPTSPRSDSFSAASEIEDSLKSGNRSERSGVSKHATARKRSSK
jgi:hypothetical protein